MARRPTPEPDFDRELFDLPADLRWREWKARVEAVLFAAAKPVSREILARVVGRDCALELLLDDLKEDFRGRPIELVRAAGSFTLHTKPAFGPAVRVAFDIPTDAKALTRLEAGVLMAVAYFQPITRGELSQFFGREVSRDAIAALRGEGFIAAGPRSPTLGAPYAYVTTPGFLAQFGFEILTRSARHREARGRWTARSDERSVSRRRRPGVRVERGAGAVGRRRRTRGRRGVTRWRRASRTFSPRDKSRRRLASRTGP